MADRATAIEDLRAALREMVAAQRRLRGRDAQRPGALTYAQHASLRVLADGEEHSAGELAAAAEVSPATLTKMLDGLERSGLVARVRDEHDRRRVGVRLTEAGARVVAEKDAEIQRAWEAVLGDAEPGEIDRMAGALRRVASLYDAF